MLKQYMIITYAYLVRIGRWELETTEGSIKNIVPEEYKKSVAEYLA